MQSFHGTETMDDLAFFRTPAPMTLASVAAESGAHLPERVDPSRAVRAAASLERAARDSVSVFHEGMPRDALAATRAGACFVSARHLALVPAGTVALVTDHPKEAFRRLAAMLHPDSVKPGSVVGAKGVDPSARVHVEARLEPGVIIDPGAVVGPHVEIGSGTFIGANTIVGAGVRIGRDCAIDAQVSLCHALVGDRVVIQPGAKIGVIGSDRVNPAFPQLGRVIIQNDVEIGAQVAIARGGEGDTIISEGSRIDPFVAIPSETMTPRNARILLGNELLRSAPI